MEIGDSIKIIELLCSSGTIGWWKPGDIYEITHINDKSFSCIKPDGDRNGWLFEHFKYEIIPKIPPIINDYNLY